MKIHDVIQGSPEWLALRAGIPTGSCFDQIWTPGNKPSSQASGYRNVLLMERILGRPCDDFMSDWMQRGKELESDAVLFYEGLRDMDTQVIGFVTNDDGTVGVSPDRGVGVPGLLEIKITKDKTHADFLLGGKTVAAKYYPQIQGQLWIAEKEWIDVLAWHREAPPALIRVERDEAYIAGLSAAVMEFSARLEEQTEELRKKGWIAA